MFVKQDSSQIDRIEQKSKKLAEIKESIVQGLNYTNPEDDSGDMMTIREFEDAIGCIGKSKD